MTGSSRHPLGWSFPTCRNAKRSGKDGSGQILEAQPGREYRHQHQRNNDRFLDEAAGRPSGVSTRSTSVHAGLPTSHICAYSASLSLPIVRPRNCFGAMRGA